MLRKVTGCFERLSQETCRHLGIKEDFLVELRWSEQERSETFGRGAEAAVRSDGFKGGEEACLGGCRARPPSQIWSRVVFGGARVWGARKYWKQRMLRSCGLMRKFPGWRAAGAGQEAAACPQGDEMSLDAVAQVRAAEAVAGTEAGVPLGQGLGPL